MDHDELGAWLRLTLTPGIGNGAARRLLARFGLPQAIFQQTEAALQLCVPAAQAKALRVLVPPAVAHWHDSRSEEHIMAAIERDGRDPVTGEFI